MNNPFRDSEHLEPGQLPNQISITALDGPYEKPGIVMLLFRHFGCHEAFSAQSHDLSKYLSPLGLMRLTYGNLSEHYFRFRASKHALKAISSLPLSAELLRGQTALDLCGGKKNLQTSATVVLPPYLPTA